MAGNILSGALVGGVIGGIVAGFYVLVMKLLGRPIGGKDAPPRERPQTVPVPPTWKTETRRVLFGVLWLFVIWFAARVVLGAVVGGIAGGQAGAHAAPGESHQRAGFIAGQTASIAFLQQYGLLILLGSLAASITGTATGFLPGTRRPFVVVSPASPASEGQWPPPPAGAA